VTEEVFSARTFALGFAVGMLAVMLVVLVGMAWWYRWQRRAVPHRPAPSLHRRTPPFPPTTTDRRWSR
jgi:hypothetical protein